MYSDRTFFFSFPLAVSKGVKARRQTTLIYLNLARLSAPYPVLLTVIQAIAAQYPFGEYIERK
jgi:hypothetical protein